MKRLFTYLPLTLGLTLVMVFMASCSSSEELSMSEDIAKMTEVTEQATKHAEEVAYKLAYDENLADDSTGFRTAGSDAEHRAADYLASEFQALGLTDVKKEPVTVDKWQFNEANLTVNYANQNNEKNSLKIQNIVSYAAQGTKQLGGDYSKLDIVDLGMGTEQEYLDFYKKNNCENMKGKIALVGVDQWDEVWIDGPYMEAATQKAAAIISYPLSGYAEYDDDTLNMQDICAPDMKLPCVSITKNDAEKIRNVIKEGKNIKAQLYVDNEIGNQNGTSYNVTGMIKGTENTGQRILVAGHYDKYFYGFEDDCAAVGLVTGIAKALLDSGYKPANDIVFIAHAAEEWGRFDTSTDWAIGSWEMITKVHPEWKGSTLALINFEMPSVDSFNDKGIMRATYELGGIGNSLLKSDLLSGIESFYKDGVVVKNDDQEIPRTDGISYQFNGVPVFMPRQEDRTEWTKNRYHTPRDDNNTKDTKKDGVHSTKLLEYQLSLYSALAMYIDGTPALALDFNSRCDDFEAAIQDTEKYASAESVEAYKKELGELREAAAANLKAAEAINADYETAYQSNDEAAMKKARAAGTEHNKKSLAAFQYVQDHFMGLADYGDVELHHKGLQNNLDLYTGVVDALSDGEITEDDIWLAAEINGYYEYYAYLFSDEVCALSNSLLMNDKVKSNWGTDKMTLAIKDSWKTTKNMYAAWNKGLKTPADYQPFVKEYQGYIETLTEKLQAYVSSETDSMKELKGMI
ncbi:M28 family peptidase [Clostridiales bacterium]|nr:M28 family peptidase [Clostridiales bacterium]